MPNTYTNLYFHTIFSTKNRIRRISPAIQDRLYAYIGGIAKNLGYKLIITNGMEEHIHLLIKMPPRLAISDILRTTKTNSSKWIHETFPALNKIAWQRGFSAFSVCQVHVHTVYPYIQNQKQHHAKKSFKEELRELLEKHKNKYVKRYIVPERKMIIY